jgi:uncharacterized protein YbjT (DUF2867 family)
MSRHVVLGTGQIDTHVARQLIDSGNEVAVVSRTGRAAVPASRRAVLNPAVDSSATAR